MASPYADMLARARVVIAALTPTTTSSQAFTSVGTLLPLADEPLVSWRSFEVVADGGPVPTAQFGTATEQARRPFTVRVRYDRQANGVTLDQIVAEDADQIVGALTRPSAWNSVTGAQSVDFTGAAYESRGESNDLVDYRLDFDCLYVRAV
jgi:hypothetical protein